MKKLVFGIDLAKPGADYCVGRCPACKTFQKMVSKDYLCKECAKTKRENILLGCEVNNGCQRKQS